MMRVYTVLRDSHIHGKGVFADEDIEAGKVVWEFDPDRDIMVPVSEVERMGKLMSEYFDAYGDKDGNDFFLDGDNGRYINHSDTPNLKTGMGFEPMVAARRIHRGEELTCDYRECDNLSQDDLNRVLKKS